MKNIILLIGIVAFGFAACKKDDPVEVVLPKPYLPAYPGSYWYYSNGEVSTVHTEYVAHSYQTSLNSPEYTEVKLVPYIDHEFLYEYKITQNSTRYPLKNLLSETKVKAWVVNEVNGEQVFRETTEMLDSIYLKFPSDEKPTDSIVEYKDIIVVVEFLASLSNTQWNTKEYYAKDIGLIRVEINNPYDTLPPIVQKQLTDHKINF